MTQKVVPEEDDVFLCAICMERDAGVRLRPCGHNHFCRDCVLRLFSCPLCRTPLLMEDGQAQFAIDPPSPQEIRLEEHTVVESRTVITRKEAHIAQGIGLGVWLFIFIFGIVEHMHDIRQSCEGGDPLKGNGPDWITVEKGDEACKACSPKNEVDCDLCYPGYYNLGTQCFKYLENLPPIRTGAALGGTVYFVLIIITQTLGIVSEVTLIRRMLRRKLMPRKELVVLLLALGIELARMFLVDIFVMQEYFGGRAYQLFREPKPCTPDDWMSWQGADAQWYCPDIAPHASNTSYYFAAHQHAWAPDANVCSTFTTESALLSFDERGLQDVPGHTRFKTVGWVIGGEFALYYFFATFINEVADNMFVVPTTTSGGWLCKIFSIALEVFQLGALCPAAIFTHKDCLHYTDPLGVSLHTISLIVVIFGYFIWGFVFMSLPLAVAGGALLGSLYMLCSLAAALAPVMRLLARRQCCCCVSNALNTAADGAETFQKSMEGSLETAKTYAGKGAEGFKNVTMTFAFLPMLCGGIFLGTLVVVGQGSKEGFMQVLTAIVLLSDVLFKIVATAVTESADFLLHLRVKRVVTSGGNRRAHSDVGDVIGHTIQNATNEQQEGQKGDATGKCEP